MNDSNIVSCSNINNAHLMPQSKLHVDLSALASNVRALKAKCVPEVSLMAVVKANAYGHGAVEVSRTALKNGASFLAVARIHEAVELREAGIQAPLLLFGDVLPSQIEWLATHDVRISIGSVSVARDIAQVALCCGHTIKVHLKVDTGMGRLGVVIPDVCEEDALDSSPYSSGLDVGKEISDMDSASCQAQELFFAGAVDEIMEITGLDGLYVEGIYTHFANADISDKSHVNIQIKRLTRLFSVLEIRGFKPEIRHAANSAAIMEIPEGHFNMVRAGIAMYGLWPSDEINRNLIDLKPVMSVVSKIVHLKEVPAGFRVSYGSTYITLMPTKIATVPIGYADGYNRLLSSRGEMLVRGVRCKVIGRVCMDYTMIDVGHIPDVALDDEVVIMGRQSNQKILADDIARHIDTINYEVVCSFNRRMPLVIHSDTCC